MPSTGSTYRHRRPRSGALRVPYRSRTLRVSSRTSALRVPSRSSTFRDSTRPSALCVSTQPSGVLCVSTQPSGLLLFFSPRALGASTRPGGLGVRPGWYSATSAFATRPSWFGPRRSRTGTLARSLARSRSNACRPKTSPGGSQTWADGAGAWPSTSCSHHPRIGTTDR
jgi:hypothetical protein